MSHISTSTSAQVDLSGDLLLDDAPAYVVAAFHCIAYQHESGGDPTAQNPSSTASGLYQFLDSSWIDYGGGRFSSRAMYATVAEQDTVAWWAYQRSGFSPWTGDNACWGG